MTLSLNLSKYMPIQVLADSTTNDTQSTPELCGTMPKQSSEKKYAQQRDNLSACAGTSNRIDFKRKVYLAG
jgi:hypothetical protein